jgi:hypothetical protein
MEQEYLMWGALGVVLIIILYVTRPRPTKIQNINQAINRLDNDVAKLRNKHK